MMAALICRPVSLTNSFMREVTVLYALGSAGGAGFTSRGVPRFWNRPVPQMMRANAAAAAAVA
ncbi:MAG: hypothetical protein ACLRWF_02225 [Ruthenibacterium sp.]